MTARTASTKDFFNKNIEIRMEISLQEIAQTMSKEYVRVLRSAIRHYDSYVHEKDILNPLNYDEKRKEDFEQYLREDTTNNYTPSYIHFLCMAPHIVFGNH